MDCDLFAAIRWIPKTVDPGFKSSAKRLEHYFCRNRVLFGPPNDVQKFLFISKFVSLRSFRYSFFNFIRIPSVIYSFPRCNPTCCETFPRKLEVFD